MKNETETKTFPADMLELIKAAQESGMLSENTKVKKVQK